MPQLSRCTVWGEKAGRQTATYTAALRLGRAVLDPLSRAGNDGLPLPDIDRSTLVGDPQHPGQYHAVLIELRRLSGLGPPAGAGHARDADGARP